ncbi:MAG: phage major capsid protein [Sutterellaceae bacterium]|nr:phage major capsid protein [Burkholderiaceae bacterium]MDW8429271.1 phage major capsid protein [Sutterellaceae bacterium]
MAFPNISDIVATTIQNRSRVLADNVTRHNAALAKLSERGNVKTVSGGNVILQELMFAENNNASWYLGYDPLPTAAQDVLSAAEFPYKQLACPIVISGLEQLQNSSKEAFIDLLEGRIAAAEATMMNRLAAGVYADGTGFGGKELTGLNAAVPVSPSTGVYGGIDRAVWSFWRSRVADVNTFATATLPVQATFNLIWAQLVRGVDRPDLILVDNVMWTNYVRELQAQQRFTDPRQASFGFPSIKFMDADVVLDGGIGGFCPAKTAFFLNTKYIFLRPHAQRNMVPLSPNRRAPVNQDAEVQILAWAGNLTCAGAQFQGRVVDTRP